MLRIDKTNGIFVGLSDSSSIGAGLLERHDIQKMVRQSSVEFFKELGEDLLLIGEEVQPTNFVKDLRGDVAPLLRGRSLSVMYVLNSVLSGFFRIEKPFTSGFLAVHWLGDPKNPVTDVSKDLTDERAYELLRAGLGDADAPVTIESVMHWDATADTAERFQKGRVFLVGDAAHVMPPSGGFGGNTGVQDAHNIAWKLALVLKGLAGPDLLATYDLERRPAAAFTVEQAYSRYVTRSAPYLKSENMQPIENDLNIEFGYVYDSRAVIPEGAAREGKGGGPGTRIRANRRDARERARRTSFSSATAVRFPRSISLTAISRCSPVPRAMRGASAPSPPQGNWELKSTFTASAQTGSPIRMAPSPWHTACRRPARCSSVRTASSPGARRRAKPPLPAKFRAPSRRFFAAKSAGESACRLRYFLNAPNRIGSSARRRSSRIQIPNQATMAVDSGTVTG